MSELKDNTISVGIGKPGERQQDISRRQFLKTVAKGIVGAGVLGVGAKLGLGIVDTLEKARYDATDNKVWSDLVGGKENPHPEYGHLVWLATIVPEQGAKLRAAPREFGEGTTEFPFTTVSGENIPVIKKFDGDVWVIRNPLFVAGAPSGNGIRPATVHPAEGQPYQIETQSVWFAVPIHKSEYPTGIGWLHISDAKFIDKNNQKQWEPPVQSIIQTHITGREFWKGTAKLGTAPLEVGLISR